MCAGSRKGGLGGASITQHARRDLCIGGCLLLRNSPPSCGYLSDSPRPAKPQIDGPECLTYLRTQEPAGICPLPRCALSRPVGTSGVGDACTRFVVCYYLAAMLKGGRPCEVYLCICNVCARSRDLSPGRGDLSQRGEVGDLGRGSWSWSVDESCWVYR